MVSFYRWVFNEINGLDRWTGPEKPSNVAFWPIFGLCSSVGRAFSGHATQDAARGFGRVAFFPGGNFV
jgi:hypothetical protein